MSQAQICFACKEFCVLTKEHIIPQALGGRLKAYLYCEVCNKNFGKGIDSEITKQFGYIATLLKIKRERGNPQHFEVVDVNKGISLVFDGETLSRKDPTVNVKPDIDGKKLKSADIAARSKEELEKIAGSIQERYDVPGGIKTFQEFHPGPTDTKHEITIDNTLIRRAITKIAYSLLCIKIPPDIILSSEFEKVRVYIKEGARSDLACANFVHTQFMTDYIRPLHKIHVSLNRNDGIVVGYVSLFGTYRFTVLLSDSFFSRFEWPGLDYTFDPVRREKAFSDPRFRAPDITKEDILRPKQSLEFVQSELNKGQKVVESYVDNYEFLGSELSRPTT